MSISQCFYQSCLVIPIATFAGGIISSFFKSEKKSEKKMDNFDPYAFGIGCATLVMTASYLNLKQISKVEKPEFMIVVGATTLAIGLGYTTYNIVKNLTRGKKILLSLFLSSVGCANSLSKQHSFSLAERISTSSSKSNGAVVFVISFMAFKFIARMIR